MLISRIQVAGLFDRFDHELQFPSDEQITIMIGPNGFGKTMILRMIDTVFNKPIRTLARMPFHTLSIYFDDESKLNICKISDDSSTTRTLEVSHKTRTNDLFLFISNPTIDHRELAISINDIEDYIAEIVQVGPREWRHYPTNALLELDDILEAYGARLPWEGETPDVAIPDWLKDIRSKIAVRLIDTERLTQVPELSSRHVPHRWRADRPHGTRTIRRYSEELGMRVQETLSEYGSRAQSLDRTFPVRLVEEPSSTEVSMEHLRQELADVEDRRASLVSAGLLVQEHEEPEVPALEEIDESRRSVLAVYARDAKNKLGIFDDLYVRVDAFRRIANARLLYKEVTVGSAGLVVMSAEGASLDLEMLSSGEQHQLVILYELLFRVPDSSLILFDEPELSLHVEWQDMFLEDLEELARISRFKVLLATHSPQIIGGRWDLAVKLKGPKYN